MLFRPLLAALLLVVVAHAACTECLLTNAPVCDEEGTVFINACVAACQGVAAVRACPQERSSFGTTNDETTTTTTTTRTTPVVSMDDIHRYTAQGFVFVGPTTVAGSNNNDTPQAPTTRTGGSFNGGGIRGGGGGGGDSSTATSDNDEDNNNTIIDYDNYKLSEQTLEQLEASRTTTTTTSTPLTAIRRTADGLEYRQQLTSSSSSILSTTTVESTEQQKHNRDLTVIGTDDRQPIAPPYQHPYSAIIELDFSYRDGGCTAALIAPNAALTSAHCILNHAIPGKWTNITYLAPGRFHDATTGESNNPYGKWSMESVTFYKEWESSHRNEPMLDVAVITFAPIVRSSCQVQYPGDLVGGVLELEQLQDWRSAEAVLADSTIVGYPYDKPSGEMWTTGKCSKPWLAFPTFGFHYCDTTMGMSGAPVINANNKVVGIHGYGFETRGMNGAALLDKVHFPAVVSWAGIGTELPRLAEGCVPARNRSPWFTGGVSSTSDPSSEGIRPLNLTTYFDTNSTTEKSQLETTNSTSANSTSIEGGDDDAEGEEKGPALDDPSDGTMPSLSFSQTGEVLSSEMEHETSAAMHVNTILVPLCAGLALLL